MAIGEEGHPDESETVILERVICCDVNYNQQEWQN